MIATLLDHPAFTIVALGLLALMFVAFVWRAVADLDIEVHVDRHPDAPKFYDFSNRWIIEPPDMEGLRKLPDPPFDWATDDDCKEWGIA